MLLKSTFTLKISPRQAQIWHIFSKTAIFSIMLKMAFLLKIAFIVMHVRNPKDMNDQSHGYER